MDNANVSFDCHYGYNLPEYPFLLAITQDYIRSVNISYTKETTGKNMWEQLYHFPEYGISLFYSTLGNDEVLGREIAVTYFFRAYFFDKNRFRLFNHLGIGICYVNRKFDLEKNYINVAVGSKINAHFNYRFGANYALSDKFKLNTGISFDHFSNGNMKEPNLGINYLTAFGGFSYVIGNKTPRRVYEIVDHEKKNSLVLFFSGGGKHTRSLTSKIYQTASISLEFNRSFFRKVHFGAGVDFFYDSSVQPVLWLKDKEFKKWYAFKTGIHISPSLIYNKVTLSIQTGVHLFLVDHVNNYRVYNRGIFQYQLNDRFMIRAAMVSYLHILDYPEIGLGIKL